MAHLPATKAHHCSFVQCDIVRNCLLCCLHMECPQNCNATGRPFAIRQVGIGLILQKVLAVLRRTKQLHALQIHSYLLRIITYSSRVPLRDGHAVTLK